MKKQTIITITYCDRLSIFVAVDPENVVFHPENVVVDPENVVFHPENVVFHPENVVIDYLKYLKLQEKILLKTIKIFKIYKTTTTTKLTLKMSSLN